MDVPLFVYSPVDGHLGLFQFETITNKAAVNTCVQVFVYIYALISLWQIP